MYYILRYGLQGKDPQEREFHSQEVARKAYNIILSEYDHLFREGIVSSYTCLLLTKGVRHEEAESS